MINSWVQNHKGYSHWHTMDFVGFANVDSQDTVSVSVWPEGTNGSNEPYACAMVSIEHDLLDGEPAQDFSVLLDRDAMLKLRDMLNERFPV